MELKDHVIIVLKVLNLYNHGMKNIDDDFAEVSKIVGARANL